jgi:hypothetical protein
MRVRFKLLRPPPLQFIRCLLPTDKPPSLYKTYCAMVAAQTARAAFFYARHNSRRGIMHFQVVLFTIRTPIHSSKKETSIVVEALE